MNNSTQVANPQWDCGTAKSTGNAFTVTPRFTSEQELRNEALKKRRYDDYTKKLALRGLTRADVKRNLAERQNAENSLAAFVPKSIRAPR